MPKPKKINPEPITSIAQQDELVERVAMFKTELDILKKKYSLEFQIKPSEPMLVLVDSLKTKQ